MESILGPFFILTALNQRQHNITNEQVLTLATHMLIPVYECQESPWGTSLNLSDCKAGNCSICG